MLKYQSRQPRKQRFFKIAAIILGLLLGLTVFELGMFVVPVRHQMDNPWYFAAGGGVAASDELPFGRPPYLNWQGESRGDLAILSDDTDPYARQVTFQTDKDGFHNSIDNENAQLLFIGDSYTEAGNISENETFASLAGQQLHMQVRNLGRAGYTASTELVVLKKYGLVAQPELVVWQIAESNDLAEEIVYQQWLRAGRPPFFDFEKQGRISRIEAWKQRSLIYRTIAFKYSAPKEEWPFQGEFSDDRGGLHQIRFLPIPNENLVAYGHPGWPFFERSLAAGKKLCEQHNVQLIVLLIPRKFSVMKNFVALSPSSERFIAGLSQIPAKHRMPAQLKALCTKLGIRFVDATSALISATSNGQLVYLPFDTHLSETGHKIVADLITQTVQSSARR